MNTCKRSIYMQTTKISPEQTIGQIQQLLSRCGCQAVLTEFDQGEVVSVSFRMKHGDGVVPFKLPCRWENLYQVIHGQRRRPQSRHVDEDREQAKRVAWRQILRWVEAQIALVETEMVGIIEVFMPYILIKGEQTMFEQMEKQNFMLTDQRSKETKK